MADWPDARAAYQLGWKSRLMGTPDSISLEVIRFSILRRLSAQVSHIANSS